MLLYTIGAGITKATAPDLPSNCLSTVVLKSSHSLIYLVNTSLKQLVVIYAPAALLGGDCHFNAPSPVSSPNSPSLVSYQVTLPPNDTDELHAKTAMLIKSYTSS